MDRRFVPSTLVRTSPRHGLWFAFRGNELLVDVSLEFLRVDTPRALGFDAVRTQYLGEFDGEPCFSAELPFGSEAPDGMRFVGMRGLLGRLPDELTALAGRALQIMEWDRTHQFCGACGGRTEPHAKVRARTCAVCKLDVYPRLSPAMIVAVERGDEILLARSSQFPPGIYSALAGFVDPGESVEDAVHREVFEEVGIRVKNVRYFGSQPWPFPNSLMLGFQAEYDGGDLVLDPEEIEDASFFRVDTLPRIPPGRVSIAQWLIEDFCRRNGRGV